MADDPKLVDAALVRAPGALFDGYIFDLDGTVYLGDALLPGARRLLARLRALGRRTVFLSNNPTKDPEEYAAKLAALGVAATSADIINTVVTMTDWLVLHYPEAVVFPIAEAPLQRALRAAGIRLSENPAEIDFVIASYDRTFDALWYHKRARLIATNPDRYCPFPGGRGEPDAAAIIAALEACAGVTCELVTGKPSPLMLDAALRVLDLPAARCVMVGDRLATDIRMARAAEMPSALVLTGDTTAADLRAAPTSDRPDYVLTRIDQLLPSGSA